MQEDFEIMEFLPVFSEQEYTSYLHRAFEQNYENGFYHFAYLAYYMLVMRFICIKFWQISTAGDFHGRIPSELKRQLIHSKAPAGIDPEQSGILDLVKKQILPDGQSLQNLIDLRNNIAHANGYINIPDASNLESRLSQINTVVSTIQTHSENTISNCYFKFLVDSPTALAGRGVLDSNRYDVDEEISVYVEDMLVREKYLSRKDITRCITSNTLPLPGMKDSEMISSVHDNLCKSYPIDSDFAYGG